MVDPAFAAFFDEMFDRTVAVARRVSGDQAVAQDVAAETFTRAYVRWGQLADDPRRAGWVVRVATNLAIDVARKRPPAVRAADPADAAVDAVLLRTALVEALRRLSRREREAVTLRYLADMSEADVAAALGVSPGSVKTYVHRGLARLRPMLSVRSDQEVEGRLAAQSD